MVNATKLWREMWNSGGFRERYAMKYGTMVTIYIDGRKCYKFIYDEREGYQDANGATYDTERGGWIG
jgi:hypothetical protein